MSGNILIVDSSETHRTLLRAQLEAAYFTAVDAPTGEAAMVIAQSQAIDVILLNVDLRNGHGIEACRLLKAKPGLAHIPIVLMAAEHSTCHRIRGFEADADDFLSKPVNAVALFARMRSLARFRMMTEELHRRDATSVEFGLSELSPETSDETGCKLAIIARD